MDQQRFDFIVKQLAAGTSRRTVLKLVFGLGGSAIVGGIIQGDDADARRSNVTQLTPAPTPTPVPHCPGVQKWNGSACTCPGPLSGCGPDCCNPSAPKPGPTYSECCDNECCFGHCYGEELCCPYPRQWCEPVQECCAEGYYCCGEAGCCPTPCCDGAAGPLCCSGETTKCCPGDICIPDDGCCSDAECSGCQSCQNYVCADDQSQCPGCLDCANGQCITNSGNCDDGDGCTTNTCQSDGNCTYTYDCRLSATCCSDGDPCTADICSADGTSCSHQFDCKLGDCCPGQQCGADGACFTPCADLTESCADVGCCTGQCFEDICVPCIPNLAPCLALCDFCCSGQSYLGFCVTCGPPFASCEDDENSCCDGLCCQYNPIGDNFCAPACV